ncbi:MAG: DUF748 domain-containing protein [Deltaproteobacteria bacterium]|nr:DUF748 domain-containing protein [Deltaproteobacteria bacterium]
MSLLRNRLLLIVLALATVVRVALPYVVRRVAVDQADKALVGRIELDDVDLSLLTGGITLHGLRVFATEATADSIPPESAPVFSATRLSVELGFRALLHKIVEVQRFDLDGFAVSLDRARDGTLVLPLPAPAPASEPPAAEPKEARPGWGVLIRHVALRDGRIGFRDFALGDQPQHIEGRVPTLDAGNLAVLITESGLEPGKIALEAGIEDGTLRLEVTLENLAGGPAYQSHLVLTNLPIAHARLYIPKVGWSDLAGRLDLDVVHRFESRGAHTLHGTVALRDVAVRVQDLDEPALAWSALAIDVAGVDLVKQHAEIGAVTLAGARVVTRPAGPEPLPVLHGLAQPAAEGAASQPPPLVTGGDSTAKPWTWAVANVTLKDARVHALGGDGPLDVGVEAAAANLASAAGTQTRVALSLAPSGGGTLALAGDLTLQPIGFDGTVRADGLVLAPLTQPIATAQTRLLKNGVATVNLAIAAGTTPKAPSNGARIAGTIDLANLEIASDDPKPFALRWNDLAIELREVTTPAVPGPIAVALASVSLVRPEIVATRTYTGIALPAALTDGASPPPPPPTSPVRPPLDVQVRVDKVAIQKTRVAFSDEAVRPFYRSNLDPIDLTCVDLRWPGPFARDAQLLAKGLDGASLKVTGNLAPAGSHLLVTLADLPLAPFNPYATASGYGVAGGTARLDSTISIAPASYETTSKLVLSQLAVTGGAGDSLFVSQFGMPLALALALLTDLEGNIVLDLPIAGDAQGMRTGLGTLVGNALARAILNAVTSPLKLVGAVANLGEKPASLTPQPMVFQPGRIDLAAGEDTKLAQLESLLAAAPGLKLHLRGETGEEDRRWLREQALRAKLERESGVVGTVRHIGERGARSATLAALAARTDGKAAEIPEEHRAWFEAQVAAQDVADAALHALAAARAKSVQSRLESGGGVGADRVLVDDESPEDVAARPVVAIGLGSPAERIPNGPSVGAVPVRP